MRWLELAERNFKGMWRDWLSLGVNVGLPILLVLVLQALEGVDDFFAPASLAPGVALFGFAMLTMTSAMALAQDRESSLFARLLTTPLRANDFVLAYSLPYVVVALIQAVVVFAVAFALGMTVAGGWPLVVLVVVVMALFYVAMGMLIGAVTPYKAVTGPWVVVLLLTIFGGTWVNLEDIGGVFQTAADWFPFSHALEAMRGAILGGAGFGDALGDLWWVLGYTAAVMALAVWVFRSRMVE
ncbi:MAG: ABC transporter permease [Actinobacteria bacterium]|nr:ABC transporter permease [Actinomycetota bacterium]